MTRRGDDSRPASRQSRTSNTSQPAHIEAMTNNGGSTSMIAPYAPGILNMLRTTTDTGDLGALSVNQGRMPLLNRVPARKRPHIPHPSNASLNSAKLSRNYQRGSDNAPWERTSSSGHRGSIGSSHTARTVPAWYDVNYGPPPHPPPTANLPPNPHHARGGFDMQANQMRRHRYQQPLLAIQRSASSLRSQASTTRLQRYRNPYPPPLPRHPSPGIRPVSPAVSDFYPLRPSTAGPYMHRPLLQAEFAGHPGDSRYYQLQPQPRDRRLVPMSRYQPRYTPSQTPSPALSEVHVQLPEEHLTGLEPTATFQVNVPEPLGDGPQQQLAQLGVDIAVAHTPTSSAPGSSLPHSSSPQTPRDSDIIRVVIKQDSPEPARVALRDEEVHILLEKGEKGETDRKPVDEQVHEIGSPLFGLETASVLPYEEMLPAVHSDDESSELDANQHGLPPRQDGSFESSRMRNKYSQPTGGLVQRIKYLLEAKSDLTGSVEPTWKSSRFDIEPRTHSPQIASETFQHPGLSAESRITRATIKAAVSPSSTGLEAIPTELTSVPHRESGQFDLSSISSSEYSSIKDQKASRQFDPLIEQQAVLRLEPRSKIAPQGEASLNEPRTNAEERDFSISSGFASIDDLTIRNGLDKEVLAVRISQHVAGGEAHKAGEVASRSQATEAHFTSCEGVPSASAETNQRQPVHPRQLDSDAGENLDAKAGITSDIVTDIAVRFSIPHQSVLPKASVISVSSASEKSSRTKELHKDIHELPSSTSPRESLWGADAIPPLQVTKQQDLAESTTSSGDGADLSSFIRRSFPRRHSAFFGDRSSSQTNETDTRPRSAFDIYPTNSGRLPGVKEDSQEDFADAQLGFNVKPARLTSDYPPGAHSQARPPLSLSEIRNLPSLNFSQMNLIDQLNAALALRDSFGALGSRTSASVASPTPLRPASTDALRERYTSFFMKPQDFQVQDPIDESESFSLETLIPVRKEVHNAQHMPNKDDKKGDKISGVKETSTSSSRERARSLSPTELLGMASEVEMMEIPSVAGLSARLSALLPSLRPHLDSMLVDEEAVEQTIDEIHQLGQRPTTMLSARSSGVLRSLAAIADDIATNGTHSSAFAEPKPRYNKKLPPLPINVAGEETDQSVLTTTEATMMSASDGSLLRDATVHGLRRTRSEIRGSTTLLRPDIPSASQTRRSLTISTPNSRPWNYDKNYPWSAESGLVSIDFGPNGNVRESIASHFLRETASTPTRRDRTRRAVLNPGAEDTIEDSSLGMDHDEFDPTATVTADTVTAHHTRKLSKKAPSLLESLSKRAKLVSPTRPSMESVPSTHRPWTAATMLSIKSTKSKAHAVGDRYPSTALQAPIGYDVDEMRSYFSDDGDSRSSSAQGIRRRLSRTNVIKKRLSGLRFRPEIRIRPASDVQDASQSGDERVRNTNRTSGMDISMLSMGLNGDMNAIDDADEDATLPMGPQGTHVDGQIVPIGMSRVELRIKRLGERVRVALAKGSDRLRRMSAKRSRQERTPSRQELHDVSARNSVYTGT